MAAENSKMAAAEEARLNFLKYLALFILTIQNTSLVIVSRYSRMIKGPMYLVTTAVVMIESLKFLMSLLLVLYENSWQVKETAILLKVEIIDKYKETAKVSVPSFLYAIQNNLFFIALTYLDAATFQVTYQMKIFTTAIFSVFLLGKKISRTQWAALFVLASAVILVQWPHSDDDKDNSSDSDDNQNSRKMLGLLAVTMACLSSGFSGVYFEKVLKGTKTSVWIRNIQLGFMGMFFALLGVLGKDRHAIAEKGFFQGYSYIVWTAIVLQAIGGLVVAAVIKYADNILKGFATAVSIVLSSILSYFLLGDFVPTLLFGVGGIGVIGSIFMYGYKPKEVKSSTDTPAQQPSATADKKNPSEA